MRIMIKATIHLQRSGRGEGRAEELRKYLSTVVGILPHFIHELGGHANPFCNSVGVVKETHQTFVSSDSRRLQLHWYNCYSCQFVNSFQLSLHLLYFFGHH